MPTCTAIDGRDQIQPGTLPDGGGTSLVVKQLSFSWDDTSPEFIGIVLANKMILSVQLIITEAFDGVSPSLSVGEMSSPARLMATTDNDPTDEVEFLVTPHYTYLADTDIFLTIDPGSGAAQGKGLVLITSQP